jgi:NADH-quinone oxidoreductase subunit J
MTPSGIEQSTLFTVIWWAVAAGVVIAAFLVIQLGDLLKAALALIASFLGVAGLFVMLSAEFLAAVQLLIYAGAIPILIIFAVLLLRDVQRGSPFNRLRVPALFLAAMVLAILVYVVTDTRWSLLQDAAAGAATAGAEQVFSNPSPILAGLLLRDFALPLEAVAVLLLASILGALALVREREP